MEQQIKRKEAKSRAIVLEMTGDIPDADVKPPDEVLFVCKLNPVTTDEDLELIFSRFGTIKSCEVIRDHKTGDSLNFAFIEFETEAACIQAYEKMNNVLIDDRRIKVDFSQSVSKLWNRYLLKPRKATTPNAVKSKLPPSGKQGIAQQKENNSSILNAYHSNNNSSSSRSGGSGQRSGHLSPAKLRIPPSSQSNDRERSRADNRDASDQRSSSRRERDPSRSRDFSRRERDRERSRSRPRSVVPADRLPANSSHHRTEFSDSRNHRSLSRVKQNESPPQLPRSASRLHSNSDSRTGEQDRFSSAGRKRDRNDEPVRQRRIDDDDDYLKRGRIAAI